MAKNVDLITLFGYAYQPNSDTIKKMERKNQNEYWLKSKSFRGTLNFGRALSIIL